MRSKHRDEGVLQARLVFDLFLKAGGRAGRMKQCCMTEAVVYLQRPSSRAFVLLPEPRGELVEVGQPRGRLVAVEVLVVEGRHLGHLIRHEFRASIAGRGPEVDSRPKEKNLVPNFSTRDEVDLG